MDLEKKILNISCDSCGCFSIFEGFNQSLNQDQRRLLAGYLYETKNERESDIAMGKDPRVIDSREIDIILSSSLIPKTPKDHYDKIIMNTYKNGGRVNKIPDFNHPACGYAKDGTELLLMIQNLSHEGFLSSQEHLFMLTMNGMKYAESILNSHESSNHVFIAMKFGDSELEKIKEEAIKPATKECGFEAITVNDDEYLGNIPERIIGDIKRSRFVIADFTNNNNGVYYESGYAMGLGIPVIKTCSEGYFNETGVHFDVKQDNFILWKTADDLKQKLIDRINAII